MSSRVSQKRQQIGWASDIFLNNLTVFLYKTLSKWACGEMPMWSAHPSARCSLQAPLLPTVSEHRQHAACGRADIFWTFGSHLGLRSSAVFKASYCWLEKEVSQEEKAFLAECSHHGLSCMTGRDGNKPPAVFPTGVGPIQGHVFSPTMRCTLRGHPGPQPHSHFTQRFRQKPWQQPTVPAAELLLHWGQL